MDEPTIQGVTLRCFFAFGQGAGPDCDLGTETLGGLYQHLAHIFESVDLATWARDEPIAIPQWKNFGRLVAESGKTDLASVERLIRDEILRAPVPTRYCRDGLEVLAR